MDWPADEGRISRTLRTAVDVIEKPDAYMFKADLPGMRKEDVRVRLDGRMLSISGERARERIEDNERFHLVERTSGRFERQFKLPQNADLEKIQAKCEEGVLTVHVPKRAMEERPKAADIFIHWRDAPTTPSPGQPQVQLQVPEEMRQQHTGTAAAQTGTTHRI
eukprot:jgi/Mesvir1/21142/Mv14190-RA.1